MEEKYSKNDISIQQTSRFRKLEQNFLNLCKQFGYQEIRTSTIEPLYIFTPKGVLSDSKLKRIYSFIDWDGWTGERVALRPDSSTCVVRYYNQRLREEKRVRKLCYVENHFEFSDAGDSISERWQCGVENIGETAPAADAEVIYMALSILKETSLKQTYLYLYCPSLIHQMINTLNLTPEQSEKLKKAVQDEPESAKQILNKTAGREDLFNTLFLKAASVNSLKNLKSSFKNNYPVLDNLISVCTILEQLQCPYSIDFSFSDTFEYYTGVSFQITSSPKRKNKREILCSGGRYDNLIANMGELPRPIPATGFALYVRNILDHIAEIQEKTQNMRIYIAEINKPNLQTARFLCAKLSNLGFNVQITFKQPEQSEYEDYGLIIHVDQKFDGKYKVLYSQKIGKPLLMNLLGELNE